MRFVGRLRHFVYLLVALLVPAAGLIGGCLGDDDDDVTPDAGNTDASNEDSASDTRSSDSTMGSDSSDGGARDGANDGNVNTDGAPEASVDAGPPGTFDTSFGVNGKAVAIYLAPDGGPGTSEGYSIAVRPDGRIVLGGTVSRYLGDLHAGVVQFTAAGDVDTSFGAAGFVDVEPPNNTVNGARGREVFLRPNGELYFAVARTDSASQVVTIGATGSPSSIALLDAGAFFVPRQGSQADVSDMLVANDKVLLAGYDGEPATKRVALTRFHADGGLDPSFGGSGQVLVSRGANVQAITERIDRQSDGKLIVTGYDFASPSGPEPFAIRLDDTGIVDSAFLGRPTGTASYEFTSMAVAPDDAVYLGGKDKSSSANGLWKMARDGGAEAGFTPAAGPAYFTPMAIKIQDDGKVLVTGWTFDVPNNTQAMVLFRYNANGTLDTSFGTNGSVSSTPDTSDIGTSIAITPSGKIVVGGWSTTPTPQRQRFAVWMVNP